MLQQQATILIPGFALQTVERACSKRRVLLVARLPRKESTPGRSASTLKIADTSVERPSSVQPGWLLLLTACRIPARSGSILLHLSRKFMMQKERSLNKLIILVKLCFDKTTSLKNLSTNDDSHFCFCLKAVCSSSVSHEINSTLDS